MHKLKEPLEGIPRKKVFLKFQNINEDEGYFDVDKNIQKLLSVKLLGFLPFYIQGNGMQVLQNRKKYL